MYMYLYLYFLNGYWNVGKEEYNLRSIRTLGQQESTPRDIETIKSSLLGNLHGTGHPGTIYNTVLKGTGTVVQ